VRAQFLEALGHDVRQAAGRGLFSSPLAHGYGNARLQVLDISDRSAPVAVGNIDTKGHSIRVDVSGNLACLAGYWTGSPTRGYLDLIDVSNPANPRRLGEIDPGGLPHGVAISGNVVFVVGELAGLGSPYFDINPPTQPRFVGEVRDLGGLPRRL
jgi:hypothetical protein